MARSYGESMDARLWGGLQNHIDLAMVYVKLPIGDFFRLRGVCKEWDRLASDRAFLEETFKEPIAKPYFVVGTWKMNSRLLAYDGAFRRWSWTRVPPSEFQVQGVFVENFGSRRVFNVHTRVLWDPPPPPKTVPSFPSPMSGSSDDDDSSLAPWDPLVQEPLMGMTVDTSVWPYTFQVILGDDVIETRIYDSSSNSWTYNLSYLSEIYDATDQPPSCAHCHGFLYIRVWRWPHGSGIDLHRYNFETETWTRNSPSIPDDDGWQFCDIGAWQDRLLFFGVKKSQSSCAIIAFELSDRSSEEYSWTVFDRMPEDLCLYMLAGQENFKFKDTSLGVMDMQSIFCDEYVLVYNCVGWEEVTGRAVLYNLDRKTWEIVELPGPDRLLWREAHNGLSVGFRDSVSVYLRQGSPSEREWELEWESEEDDNL